MNEMKINQCVDKIKQYVDKVKPYADKAVGFAAKYIVWPVAIITTLAVGSDYLADKNDSLRLTYPEGYRTVLTYKDTNHNGLYDILETKTVTPLGHEVTEQEIKDYVLHTPLEKIVFEN